MTLTPAQARVLTAIREQGYAVSCYFAMHYNGADGTRYQYRIIETLRRKGYLKGVAVKPYQTVNGYTNQGRVTTHIVVATEKA